MAITFGSMLTSIAKSAVKNQIKRKGIEIIERTIRTQLSKKMIKGSYTFFKSDRDIDRFNRHLRGAAYLPKNLRKFYRSRNLHQAYNKSKSIHSSIKFRVKDIKNADKLRNLHEGGKLNNLEKQIFAFAQQEMSVLKKSPGGTFNIEDLIKNEDIRDIVRKYISLAERGKGEEAFKLTRYDANYLFRHFNDGGDLSKEELKEKLVKRFNDGDEAEREYNVLLKRLDKNVEAGYVSFDEESGRYRITSLGSEEAKRVSTIFEFTSYDANVIFEYIRKNNGSISMEQLQLELMKTYDDIKDRQSQFRYLAKRFEDNHKAGFLDFSDGKYVISDKGIEKLNEFRALETEKMREYFEKKFGYFSAIGLLNDREEGLFQITDKYFKMIGLQDIREYIKFIEPIEKLENFKVNNFQKYVLKVVHNDGEYGLHIGKMFFEFKNDIKVEDPELKFKMFQKACERLTVQGYMELRDDKYYLTDVGATYVHNKVKGLDKVFEFGFADIRIVKMIDDEGGYLSMDRIKELIPEEEKQRMLMGRINKLEKEGFVEITEKGYIQTDACKVKCEEFYQGVRDNMKLWDIDLKVFDTSNALAKDGVLNIGDLAKNEDLMRDVEKFLSYKKGKEEEGFVFGKYDANYLFSYFNKDTNKVTIDELREKLEKRYTDSEKGVREFDTLTKRLEKNIEAGYVCFDEKSQCYTITESGLQQRKKVGTGFEFTSYDANVIFEYINKKDGKITLSQLQVELSKEYADPVERQNQFNYLEKRFNKNVEAGYLSLNKGEYSITSSGFEKLSEHKSLRNEDALEFISKKLDYLSSIGYFNALGDGRYEVTINTVSALEKVKNQNEVIVIGDVNKLSKIDDFKLNNFHKHVLRRINEDGGSLDLEKLLADYRKDNEVFDAIRKIKSFQKSADRLVVQGYVEVKDNKYFLTDKVNEVKGIGVTSDDFKFGFADTRIFRMIDQENGCLSIDRLREKVPDAQKQRMSLGRINKLEKEGLIEITEKGYVKTELGKEKIRAFFEDEKERKEKEIKEQFKLSKFDLRVFKEAKDGFIDLGKVKERLGSRYGGNVKEIDKQFNIYQGRCQKLLVVGYLKESGKGFEITEKARVVLFEERKKDVLKSFKLSKFDVNIFNKIGDYSLNLEKEKEVLVYKYQENTKEIDRQFSMLSGRCEKLEIAGFLQKNDSGYVLTDKAREALDSKSELFQEVKVFRFGDYDRNVVFKYFNSDNQLSLDSLKVNLSDIYKDHKTFERQYQMVHGRLLKNFEHGYVDFDKDKNVFVISDKGLNELKKVDDAKDIVLSVKEIRALAFDYRLDVKRYENHIVDLHKWDSRYKNKSHFHVDFDIKKGIDDVLKDKASVVSLNSGDRKGYIFEKKYSKAIGVDPKGRALNILRVVIDEKGNVKTAFPCKNFVKDIEKVENIRKYNFTKFDYVYIAGVSEEGVWSREGFRNGFFDRESSEVDKRIVSVEKRMETLKEVGLVRDIGNGEFALDGVFLDRYRVWQEKRLDKFSTEQKQVFSDIKQFLNLTDKQISSFIYNDNDLLAKTDVRQLVNRGYLGEVSRDLKGDGEFTKVYYLTSEGKKVASHLSGSEMERVYDSKLHNRPEELRHDLVVYSAFKDYEARLGAEGCRITHVMTDKQMRAYDMKHLGHQRVEYSDLYIEFEELKTGEKGFVNIEVDCDYKPHVIKSKAENIENLVWYTDTDKQMDRIHRSVENAKVITLAF